MSATPFAACARETLRLSAGLKELERAADILQLPPLVGREWYGILEHKLVPQLAEEPFLVAAVVGGTNTGKSVIFNHVLGERVSATSPLASGTKHPVCLMPSGFADRHDLSRIFRGFALQPWEDAGASLIESTQDQLFYRKSAALPENLLVLDTPDIDSDARVNWQRADHIRASADVLIAILTSQKYNDAAVKQFFRKVAADERPVFVVFNQVILPDDAAHWPGWLATFEKETGLVPQRVYLSPHNPRAAEANQLEFLVARPVPKEGEAKSESLRDALSKLHFSEIKLQTLSRSLVRLIDTQAGAPAYLDEIRNAARQVENVRTLLSGEPFGQVADWPKPQTQLIVGEIRTWWRDQRQGWPKHVHDVYANVANTVTFPIRWVHGRMTNAPRDAYAAYRRLEWDAMLKLVDGLFDKLTEISQGLSGRWGARLEPLTSGAARTTMLQKLSADHASCPLSDDLQRLVAVEMQTFAKDSPAIFEFLKRADTVAAALRPATSVVLFVLGAGPVGHALLPIAHEAAHSMLWHFVGDAGVGVATTVAADTALSGGARGMRQVEARLRGLQDAFMQTRLKWLADWLRLNYIGTLLDDLQAAQTLPQSPQFREVETSLKTLVPFVTETQAREYS